MDTTVVSSLADGSRAPVRRRVALVFTDIVGSTRLLSALGDWEGNRRILEHHRLATRVLRRVGGGDIINTGGDSIFLAFPKPREALRFALRLQSDLRRWLVDEPIHLRVRDRVGIHFGEVEEAHRPDGARDLTGFAVSLAFSVMELAGPDQILLSAAAFDSARAAADEGELSDYTTLRWLSHGRYQIKGLDLPVPIFEVGEESAALLQPPGHSPDDRATDEDLIGWRPAIAQPVPGTPWLIERFLGSSGFGEVWLARSADRRNVCALRFCFRQDRVRALREATPLFERLKEDLADCPGITRLDGFQFDHAPHYLENEYVPGISLAELCHPSRAAPTHEAYRLEIIAQIAEALDAAHGAGIVHGDLKPAVVVVQPSDDPTPKPRVKVIDFGTGLLLAKELATDLAEGITPPELSRPDPSPAAGAPLYWAPELFKGSPPSPASDIYALGVLLYQVLVCDLSQPVTVDVARQVRDPLLLDDLLTCLATNPGARLGSASQLASRLRRLPERRRDLARHERRAYWQGVLRTAAVAVVMVGLTGWLAWRAMQKEQEATRAAWLASEAQRVAETNAVRLRVANGVRLMAEGDLTGSLEQFVEALRQDSGGPAKEDIHRRRIASVLRSAPRQVHEWHLGSAAIGLAIDPNGQWIAAGTTSGRIEVWNVDDGTPAGPTRHAPDGLDSLGFTPNDRQLYSHTADGDLLVWPWSESPSEIQPKVIATDAASIACSPDGRWFAVSDRVAGVTLHARAEPQAPSMHLDGPPGVYYVAFSRNGTLLAGAAGLSNNTLLCLWDVPGGKLLTQRAPPGAPVRFLEFDPATTTLLVATERQVHLLSLPDLAMAAPSRRHEDVIMWAGFAPRSSLMMSTSAGPGSRVQVLDIAGAGGLPVDLPHPHSVTGGDLSPDGRYVLTGCFDRHLRLWDPGRVHLVSEPVRHPAWRDHRNFQVRFLPDGRRAVTLVDDAVRVFDFASHASTVPPLELEAPLTSLSLAPHGRQIAGATRDGQAAIWDSETGVRITDRIRHPGSIRQILFNHSGSELLALEANADAGQPCRLWTSDLTATKPAPRVVGSVIQPQFAFTTVSNDVHVLTADGHWWTWSLDAPGNEPRHRALGVEIRGAEVSQDGRSLATISDGPNHGSQVNVWTVDSGERRCPPLDPGFQIRRLAFSGDGLRLATACTDGLLEPRPAVCWDLTDGRRIEPAFWHEDGVLTVAYHPGDPRVVTGGEDSLVRLWDPRGTPPLIAEQRMGYQVLYVGFNEDGRLFASASVDGTVRVWESDTGEPVTPVLRHPGLVWKTWFTAGSTRLLTLCNDGRGYLWDISPTTSTPDQLTELAEFLKGDRTPGSAPHPAPPSQDPGHWHEDLRVSPVAIAAWHRREAGLCIKEGRDDLALTHIEHALAAMPDHWPLHWQRAVLLEKTADHAAAISAYSAVVRLDPDCVSARQRIPVSAARHSR